MMTRGRTATEDLSNIVRFPTVHIPRFVTWGNIEEIFFGVDLSIVNG
jgi:hypothetical protein